MNSKDRLEYNTIETNNEYFEELSVQPDFNYYQAHDFHKLAMKPGKLKTILKVPFSHVLIFVHSRTKRPKCTKIRAKLTRKRAVRKNKYIFLKYFFRQF